MSLTKTAVRYFTRTGNTKKIAEAIAQGAGCEALPTSERIKEPVDILFLGGALYAGNLDPSVKGFIEHLDRKKVGKVILFGDAAYMNPCRKMRVLLSSIGLPAETDEFFCKAQFKIFHKGHPDQTDLEHAEAFAKKWITADPISSPLADHSDQYANYKKWNQ